MAKYWQPGSVKTRLGAEIGMRAAAQLHRVFCVHLAREFANSADERSFVITPAHREKEFQQALPAGWAIEVQSDGDLGCRMKSWFAARGDCRGGQVLIGADCPLLERSMLPQVGRLLGEHDLVVGPALDGGYYLIALRDGWHHVYSGLMDDMPWSQSSLFETTCRRAQRLGLKLATLPLMEDIDTMAELQRLRGWLADQPMDSSWGVLGSRIEQIISRESES